jgi:hypothetical protein
MRKASYVTAAVYQKNEMFNLANPVLNKDDVLVPFVRLREKLAEKGYDLATQDIHPIEDSELVVFFDMPVSIPDKKPGQLFYLLAYESIAVLPRNFNRERYQHFDRVFTWADDFVDGTKVIKINYTFRLEPREFLPRHERTKLVCLVSNNKLSPHKNELYSERVRAIHWFEKHQPQDFDLYGMGWDYSFGGYYIMKLQEKLPPFRWGWSLLRALRIDRLISRKYHTYLGPLSPKIPKLREYQFNICFENVSGVRGYITEKIFDCFLAGCVPVYLGAPNISDHIPENCYVDQRRFRSYDELYRHLKNMSDAEYQGYLDGIRDFLRSEKSRAFEAESFGDIIVGQLAS